MVEGVINSHPEDRLKAIADASQVADTYDWAASQRTFTRRELEGIFGLVFLRGAGYIRNLITPALEQWQKKYHVAVTDLAALQETFVKRSAALDAAIEARLKMEDEIADKDGQLAKLNAALVAALQQVDALNERLVVYTKNRTPDVEPAEPMFRFIDDIPGQRVNTDELKFSTSGTVTEG